jgi:DNA-binding MarR family transcriptional regulator
MSTPSYIPLIEKWEKYIDQTGNESLEHFAVWLLDQSRERPHAKTDGPYSDIMNYFEENAEKSGSLLSTAQAGFFIGRLYKFVKFYAKNIFSGLPVRTLDEFGILASLDQKEECNKKKLIIDNLIEMSTGIDIVKRLIRLGLINEEVNQEDKRQKLVSLSPKGRDLIRSLYQKMAGLPDVLGNLGKEERLEIVRMLFDLNHFHTMNYEKLITHK